MNHSTLTIEEVEQAFTDWRTNKSGNPPIPEGLWDQVKILLSTYRRGEVLRRLRLTIQQARDKGIVSVEQYHGTETANPFIQIPLYATNNRNTCAPAQRFNAHAWRYALFARASIE